MTAAEADQGPQLSADPPPGPGASNRTRVTARAEHVGSLLRPPALLEARRAHAVGQLDDAAFKHVEDEAVREVVALQHAVGFPVVTDGELRRESFQSDLCAAVDGFEGVTIDAWLWGDWHSDELGDQSTARPPDLAVVAPLRARRTVAAEELTFLRSLTDGQTKVTLPSPSMLASLWTPERSRDAYPALDDFLADVLAVLADAVRELARLGCTYVQLDAPHYPLLIDPAWREFYTTRARAGMTVERWLGYGIELDNALIDAAPGITFGFHLCRGNQGSRWLVAGGYDAIAKPVFAHVRAHRLLLEYDDERSGGFDPLRFVRDDTTIVLGLVTTKTPRQEAPDELIARVRDASRLVGLDRLAVGTQCGFSTSIVGNAITIDDQRRKLATLVRTAEALWG